MYDCHSKHFKKTDYGAYWDCKEPWASCYSWAVTTLKHDDVIKWKHFPRYWPFVWAIHRSPVNSPQKGQWRGALMFSSIGACIKDWINNCEAGDSRCHNAHYDGTVMSLSCLTWGLMNNAQDWIGCNIFSHDIVKLLYYIFSLSIL